ncbi:unnamed protein product [Triticum turgidum subsp. durum]|uniref:NB-ARC domain-containing protein n=1 Tax=Triticum turgidum subsp. durum TaxID=4567 RepID=A0A9R0XA57_TRITD|nr:unnamed protein product [Triticum turgidum subsp. durum]
MTPAAPARKMTKMILRANASEKKNLMAGKIEKIKEEVCKLRVDMDEFNLISSDSDASIEPPVTDVIEIEEPIIVGRDKQILRIMESIPVQAGHCTIVHIYGQDGSGKTTLARMVFNHTRFKDYSRVWIQCSGNFRLHEMGKAIISQASGEEINGDSNDDMEYVRKRLDQLLDNGIKVLVVLDNTQLSWDDSEKLTDLLREGNNLSEVIVVETDGEYDDEEDSEIVWRFGDTREVKSGALSDDMCWTIIKQRSRFEGRLFDKQGLEQIGAEIAKKCEGSPLAAAVLGGMLLYKDATGWAEVLNNDIWAFDHISEPFLKLAYTSMPPRLRLCFAYCAMIQYGHTIAKDDLIYQWTSLGLLDQSDKFSMIHLGEQYIGMLLDMSLLQTVPVSVSYSTVHTMFKRRWA